MQKSNVTDDTGSGTSANSGTGDSSMGGSALALRPGLPGGPEPLTVLSMLLIEAVGMPPIFLLARGDTNQVCMLDTVTPTQVDNMVWATGPIDGGLEGRERVKWFSRVRFFGEGTITTGRLVILCDEGQRREEYSLGPDSGYPLSGVLVVQETTPDMVGRSCRAVLQLDGTGVVVRACQMLYEVLN